MLVPVENSLEGTPICEIRESVEENGLSVGQLKHCYLQLAKRDFQGRVFVNKDTKKPIRVSKDGLMEWWRKSRKREHIVSVQLLGFFLENAVFVGESPDYKNRPEIEGASRFESVCKVNGRYFRVVVTTRKGINDIDKFRYYALKDMQ